MIRKLSEIELLKFWLDAEVTIVHAMIAFIAVLIVKSPIADALLAVYIVMSILYATMRMIAVLQQDPDYLKIPNK